MVAPVVRIWPKVSKYNPSHITKAFKVPASRTRAFLGSRGVTAAFAALADWKLKYSARASPAVTKVVAENAAPAGRRPAGALQEYVALLETMVGADRRFFGLRATDPIGFGAMRDAHRVLCCGPAAAYAYANPGRSSSSRDESAAPAPAPAPAPAAAAPVETGITKRVDLQTSWANPPPSVSANRYRANIQRARWRDFERWVAAQYGLAGAAGLRYSAYTTPSGGGPLARFDLEGMRLTEDRWDCAVSAASRMGLLMVVFRTGERGRGDGDGDGDVD